MTTVTIKDFLATLKAQGVPKIHLAFKCPACGTVQSAFDLIKAGAGADFDAIERYLGFSCVGRWTKAGPPQTPLGSGQQNGCNWTLGGLLHLHRLEVLTEDGQKRKHFEVCTPKEAQDHMGRNVLNSLDVPGDGLGPPWER